MSTRKTLSFTIFFAMVCLLMDCKSPVQDTPSQVTPISSAKAITAFSFANPAVTGPIIETTHTIALTV